MLLERKYPCITGVRQLESALDSARGKLSTAERDLLDAKTAEESAQKALTDARAKREEAETSVKTLTAELDDLFIKRAAYDAKGNPRASEKPALAAGAFEIPDDLAPALEARSVQLRKAAATWERKLATAKADSAKLQERKNKRAAPVTDADGNEAAGPAEPMLDEGAQKTFDEEVAAAAHAEATASTGLQTVQAVLARQEQMAKAANELWAETGDLLEAEEI